MEFTNTAADSAALLKTAWGEDSIQAAVIARTTFRVRRDGTLQRTPDEPWPITPGATNETAAGDFQGDTPFLLGGVDVWVVGHAVAPGGEPVERMNVTLRIGQRFTRSIAVIGDRRWRLAPAQDIDDEDPELVATDPEPFTRMPIGYERAFGGVAVLDGVDQPWPANPIGRGYAMTAREALGSRLPNLEDPSAMIRRWDDRPNPASLAPYPPGGSLRTERAMEMDETDPARPTPKRLTPLLLNSAHPDLVIPAPRTPRSGTDVTIEGVTEHGPLRFQLPDLRFHACVQLETRPVVLPLVLDAIGVMTEGPIDRLPRLVLSHRVVFRYRIKKGERRLSTLHAGPPPTPVPESYITDWDAQDGAPLPAQAANGGVG